MKSIVLLMVLVFSHALHAQPSLIKHLRRQLADPHCSPVQKAHAANLLAYEYLFVNHDSSRFFGHENLRIASTNKSVAQQCEAYVVLAYSHIYQADFKTALAFLQKGISLGQPARIDSSLCRLNGALGNLYEEKGDFKKAYFFYTRSYGYLGKQTNKQLQAETHFDLYTSLEQLGRHKEAEKHFTLSKNLYLSTKDSIGVCMLYLQRGILMAQMGDYKNAQPWLQKYKQFIERVDFEGDPPVYYLAMANVAKQKGQEANALLYCDSSYCWATQLAETPAMAKALQQKASLLLEFKRPAEAEALLRKAIPLYDTSFQVIPLRQCYALLMQVDSVLQKRTDWAASQLAYYRLANVQMAEEKAFEEQELEMMISTEEQRSKLAVEREKNKTAQWQITTVAITALLLLALLMLAAWQWQLQRKKYAEEKKLKTALAASNEELQRLSEVKSKLLSIMSHELRSPLTSLLGVLNLLNEEMLSEAEFKRLVPAMEQETRNSLGLLDNLLFWVKNQMNGIQIRKSAVVLNDLCVETARLFHEQAYQKNVDVKCSTNDSLLVYTDPNVAKLLIRNVLANAIKFSPAGKTIFVDISRHSHTEAAFSVGDEGAGIPAQVLESILSGKPIISQRGTAHETGAGIGLQMSFELFTKAGGRYEVKSSATGTRVCLFFELAEVDTASTDAKKPLKV